MNTLYLFCDTPIWYEIISELEKKLSLKTKIIFGENHFQSLFKSKYKENYHTKESFFKIDNDSFLNENLRIFSKRYEHILHEMIDRFSIKELNYSKKKDLLFHTLLKADYLIKKNDIKLIFSSTIPHRYFDYAFYIVSKFYKIKFITIEDTIINKRSFIINNLENRYSPNSLFKSHKNAEIIQFLKKIKNEKFQISYDFIWSHKSPFNPNYKKPSSILILSSLFLKLILNIFSFSKNNKLISNFKIKNNKFKIIYSNNFTNTYTKIISNIKYYLALNYYKKNCKTPTLKNKYFVFFSSYQPERTTCPDASLYSDILFSIDELYKKLPNNMYLYYKEHPSYFNKKYEVGFTRSINFYKILINKYPKLKFIDHSYSSLKLIDHAQLISSINGTAILEASIRNKKSLIFGDTWFKHFENIEIFCNDSSMIKQNKKLTNTDLLNDIYNKTTDLSEIKKYNHNFRIKNNNLDLKNLNLTKQKIINLIKNEI